MGTYSDWQQRMLDQQGWERFDRMMARRKAATPIININVYWRDPADKEDGEGEPEERWREFDNEDEARRFEAFLDAEGSEHWRDDD